MSATQADLWSGPVGQSWVRNALAYDTILEPLGRAELDRLDPETPPLHGTYSGAAGLPAFLSTFPALPQQLDLLN